jgi:hypothetical protein
MYPPQPHLESSRPPRDPPVPVDPSPRCLRCPSGNNYFRLRGAVAEFPHAWLKAKIGLRQFRVRGLQKVRCEALWACLAYNLLPWVRLLLEGATGGGRSLREPVPQGAKAPPNRRRDPMPSP